MTILRKPWFWVLSGVILLPILLLGFLWLYMEAAYSPSRIVDFHPSAFEARASESFFYSIGDELKYADHIDPKAQTIFRGAIDSFLVSPDKRKIAIAGDGHLSIVSLDAPYIYQVAPVDSIYKEPKPIGRSFFRDRDFQWSKDSGSIYLVKDEFYESKGSQLFSAKGELWMYDLKSGSLHIVLKPFPAYNYFFDAHSSIYFSVPMDSGDLVLKKFDGTQVMDVPLETAETIPTSSSVSSATIESPFFSIEDYDYKRIIFRSKHINLTTDKSILNETLSGGAKPYLTITRGEGFKGSYYCAEPFNTTLLPGDRYLLLPVSCDNYNGKLLIDTQTAQYQTLPEKTFVYMTLNTDTYPHFHIGGGGISIQ